MKHFIFVALFMASLATSAGGTIQIVGKIVALDEKTISVTDGKTVFTLSKERLPAQTKLDLKKSRSGDQFATQIPFDGITKVEKR